MSENIYQTRKRFALVGAQSRVEALQAEIEEIKRAFPGIQPNEIAATITKSKPGPKKNGMSEAQRKAVSERMKKYWAGKRKAAKKAASNIG